ncbi:unnamed protein product [Brachionus calyciflorus]|uniref:Uncharacterized protein n=1 Tax=Brachionus calyciflorus TaxID=104777 RepID=A0A814CLH1_9BILA|nr:unnamed protein product [Brachionus calyciflorus]
MEQKKLKTDSNNEETEFCDNHLHSDRNKHVILSQLKEDSFYLFKESSREFDLLENEAKMMYSSGRKITYDMTNDFVQYAREENLRLFKNHSGVLLKIIKQLPGFSHFKTNDLKTIMNTHFFTILTLRQHKLFINGDFYFMLDGNIQLNRDVVAALFNKKARDYVFHFWSCLKSLNLTEKEMGLIIPFLLSSIYYNLENQSLMKQIYEYYCMALFNEFKINKRNFDFMSKFSQVVCLGPKMNRMLMEA